LPQGGDIYIKRNGELLTVKQEFFALAVTGALTPAEAQAQYTAKAMDLGKMTVENLSE
jgi:hypothetical protein